MRIGEIIVTRHLTLIKWQRFYAVVQRCVNFKNDWLTWLTGTLPTFKVCFSADCFLEVVAPNWKAIT